MKKLVIGSVIAMLAVIGGATSAQAADNGHAYGRTVQTCLNMSVGAAIQAGKLAHPGAKMTAKTIAMSPHCS